MLIVNPNITPRTSITTPAPIKVLDLDFPFSYLLSISLRFPVSSCKSPNSLFFSSIFSSNKLISCLSEFELAWRFKTFLYLS